MSRPAKIEVRVSDAEKAELKVLAAGADSVSDYVRGLIPFGGTPTPVPSPGTPERVPVEPESRAPGAPLGSGPIDIGVFDELGQPPAAEPAEAPAYTEAQLESATDEVLTHADDLTRDEAREQARAELTQKARLARRSA